MEEIYGWIKNIVIYMIINNIIMNLLGNKSYKKYVSIISGMILVLIVISPLIKLMKLDENLDYFLEYNDFAIEASNFKNDFSRMEEAQTDAIFYEYEDKIRQQVRELLTEEKVTLKNFDLTIDRNPENKTFGEIIRMDITASLESNEVEEQGDSLSIKEIEISKITIDGKSKSKDKKPPSPTEINIKNKLSDFYNIEQGNINISIQGG
jgi:stage III sporulation protein AF